jgi:hypothetical protein
MLARQITLWVLAFFITLGAAYFQRRTGPTWPVKGETEFAGTSIEYTLTRSNRGLGTQEVPVITPNTHITGRIVYKRHNSDDPETVLAMERRGDRLVGLLPEQPPAGKLDYFVELQAAGQSVRIPTAGYVVARHTGPVPDLILWPHIVIIFIALLLAMRTGLEGFFSDGRPWSLTMWTVCMLFIGGLVFGPLVQKYAFGEYWTGFPFGMDLTDNKTLIAFIAWLVAAIAVWTRSGASLHPMRRWFVVAAATILLATYLIPHSLMGSELDYRAQNAKNKAATPGVLLPVLPFDRGSH